MAKKSLKTAAAPKPAHTPGPWKVLTPRTIQYAPNGRYVIVHPGADGAPDVCVLRELDAATTGAERRRKAADAELIAAAPDLLAALRDLVRQIEISGAIDDYGHPMKNLRALAVARAALAKAEGR